MVRAMRFYTLTLRLFDEGCREPEGADSFLREEFGREFWRQRVTCDEVTRHSHLFTYYLYCGAHVTIPRASVTYVPARVIDV